MSGEERRNKIIDLLSHSTTPVSGTVLAKELGVSRQVIVQDIALIRSSHYEILSTHRGYVIHSEDYPGVTKIFKCRHSDDQAEDELNCIVDQGGIVLNVFVNHKVYGRIQAEMNIRSRRDVKNFIHDIHTGKSTLLKNVTSDYHYHTICADSEDILDAIEKELKNYGFLVSPKS